MCNNIGSISYRYVCPFCLEVLLVPLNAALRQERALLSPSVTRCRRLITFGIQGHWFRWRCTTVGAGSGFRGSSQQRVQRRGCCRIQLSTEFSDMSRRVGRSRLCSSSSVRGTCVRRAGTSSSRRASTRYINTTTTMRFGMEMV